MQRESSAKTTAYHEAAAYHEAGHTVAYHFLEREFEQVSIVPEDHSQGGGHQETPQWLEEALLYSDPGLPENVDKEEVARWVEREIIVTFAGSMAEKLFCRRANWLGAQHDRDWCKRMARLRCKGDAEANAYLRWLRIRTTRLVKEWQFAIPWVAKALLERQCLTQDEVRSILARRPRKPADAALE